MIKAKWRIFKRKKDVLNSFASALVISAATLTFSGESLAAPIGGEITHGQGAIGQNGVNTNINQASNRLDINWQDFSSASNFLCNLPITSNAILVLFYTFNKTNKKEF